MADPRLRFGHWIDALIADFSHLRGHLAVVGGEFWSVKFIERQDLKKIVWLFLSPLGPRKIETKIELKSVFLYCMVAD